ncbi:nuclear transport factor 2 family protein [Sodalis sp. RH21]|uniref:nuclear transport factor 2 family protein n=1 Tax=unclassified Sodalis (in: enterobacteria) TaxID=2636512 RepID=UPI0039B5B6D6
MKKILGAALFSLLMSGTCFAQSADTTAVTKAVETMRQAMVSAKKADLEKVGAPTLSYGHSSGKIQNNAEFVDAIVTGQSQFKTLDLKDQTVQVDGDVAIVRHILQAKTNDGGKPGEVKIGVMQVWQKNASGAWKLLARQAYTLPK